MSTIVESIKKPELIHCGCECGLQLLKYDKSGRERKYIHGHHNKLQKKLRIKINRVKNAVEFIYCGCGCQKTRPKYKHGRTGKFIHGHAANGKPKSEEHKQKLRIAHTGKKCFFTEEHRRNLSKSATGKKRPKPEHIKKYLSQLFKNRVFSIEHRKKLSLARAKQQIPIKDSSIEKTIQDLLNQLGVKFVKHKPIQIRNFNHPIDIFIEPNICIECDGDYWHTRLLSSDNNFIPIHRNFIIDSELELKGMKIIRLWEYDIKNNLEWCRKLLINQIKKS